MGLLSCDQRVAERLLNSSSEAVRALRPTSLTGDASSSACNIRGLLIGAGVIGVASMVAIVLSPVGGIALVALSVGVRSLLVNRRSHQRRELIERELAPLVTSIASSVRAGIDPVRALIDAKKYLPAASPLLAEIEQFKRRIGAGLDELESIERFCGDGLHPDVELLKRCLVLSRRHGGSLGDSLHRIARVVRQRQSFRRKTRAALAMHRLSAFGIALCAVLIAVMQAVMNRSGLEVVIQNRSGLIAMWAGAACVVAGLLWMLRMGREEVL